MPSLPQLPGVPAELQQLMNVKDTAEQLSAILGEGCIDGKPAQSSSVYQIEMSSPQVQSVQMYGGSSSTEVPFQKNFQRISEIITAGNGQFSQLEAQQICDELNSVIEEAAAMVEEATSSGPGDLIGGPGPGGPGPGGPKPGGPRPPGPGR